MISKSNRAFSVSIAVTSLCLLVTLLFGSFALLWLQHEIKTVAEETVMLENLYNDKIRKLDYLDEKITYEHQPIVLQSRVSQNLVPINNNQIIWVESLIENSANAYVDLDDRKGQLSNADF
tara:strand:- start:50 stop:412 length:363 start_codon:yes stop_codon:yes gene_type:complete